MSEYKNQLFEKIRNGNAVFGFSINYPNPTAIETITQGWDFVWMDAQHGEMDYHDLLNCMIGADAAGIGTIIRVPGGDFAITGPVADLNPSGIMIPMVNNEMEAVKISENLHFPPKGHRSFWNTRMIGRVGNDYYKTQDLITIVQIESAESVKNANNIAQVDGIDVLMFGPADLGLSYGIKPGTSRHESNQMKEAAYTVIQAAHSAGKYCMFIAGTATDAKELRNMGVDIIVCGSDYEFLSSGAEKRIQELKAIR